MGARPHLQGLLLKSSSHPPAAPQTSRVDLGSSGTRTAASVKLAQNSVRGRRGRPSYCPKPRGFSCVFM